MPFRRYARRKSTVAKEPPNYEKLVSQALLAQGWRVVDYAAYKKSKILQNDASVVVRQYMPKPLSLRSGLKRNWKLDFAHPATCTYLEVDGFAGRGSAGGHRTWTGFHRDRERDRDLAFAGWRGLRYGPADLSNEVDVDRCAEEFAQFIALVGG